MLSNSRGQGELAFRTFDDRMELRRSTFRNWNFQFEQRGYFRQSSRIWREEFETEKLAAGRRISRRMR